MAAAMPAGTIPAPKKARPYEDSEAILPSLLHKGQLVIENQGSVTRDYLAYERNYLAWVKLTVACLVISGGLIIRLHIREHDDDDDNDKDSRSGRTPLEDRIAIPMGAIFFVVAVLSLVAATMSFFHIQSDMLRNVGHISSGHFTQAVSLLATAAIAVACILLMIAST